MPSLRAALASVLIPSIVLVNCVCPCAAAASESRLPVSSHLGCHDRSDGPKSSHHGTPVPHDPSSRACAHCGQGQFAAANTDSTTAVGAGSLPFTYAILAHVVTPQNVRATLRRPLAVIHSPPALALLRQKCVLLI